MERPNPCKLAPWGPDRQAHHQDLVSTVACVLLATVVALSTSKADALLEVIICLSVLPTLQFRAIYHFERCERGTFMRVYPSQEEHSSSPSF